jgi:hypothetical protein
MIVSTQLNANQLRFLIAKAAGCDPLDIEWVETDDEIAATLHTELAGANRLKRIMDKLMVTTSAKCELAGTQSE